MEAKGRRRAPKGKHGGLPGAEHGVRILFSAMTDADDAEKLGEGDCRRQVFKTTRGEGTVAKGAALRWDGD